MALTKNCILTGRPLFRKAHIKVGIGPDYFIYVSRHPEAVVDTSFWSLACLVGLEPYLGKSGRL